MAAKEAAKVGGREFGRYIGTYFDRVRIEKERLVVTAFGREQVAIVPLEDLARLEQLDESRG